MTESTVNTQRAYVVTDPAAGDTTIVNAQRAYVVTDPSYGDFSNVNLQRSYVVTRPLDAGGLGQADPTKSPNYIVENGTPYVKFDPNTNDKQLFFYPSTEPKLREIKPVNYWRYFSTKGDRDRFADIYFQDENGVTIPGDYSVLGGTYYGAYTNANGLDGDPATAWVSLGANGWVGKNFADPKLVKKYRIEAMTNTNYTDENPSSWRIEFSYDGVTWITADEVNLGRDMSPSEVYEGTLPNSALTTVGQYEIIALRPNLLDFYEASQTFSGPEQLIAPHFNQVFMADRTLEDAERNQIKSTMLARATGSGVDIEVFDTETTDLSIVNPGAETGDTTGWTVSGGFTTRTGAVGETPGAYEGTYYFYGGDSTASSSAYQDIDVSASTSSVNVTWQQSHYSGDDKANIRLEFYSLGSLVGSNPGPGLSTHTGGWLERTTNDVALPAETDTVRIIIEAQRFAGNNNDAYFDAISASVAATNPSENSVPGGLQDPYIPGFLGTQPPLDETSWLLDASFVRSGHTLDATQIQLTNTSGGANYLWWVPTVKTLSTSDDTRYYWEVQMGGGATNYNGYNGIVTQVAVDSIVSAATNPVQYDSLGRRGNGDIWRDAVNIVSGLQTFGAGDRLMMLFNPSTGQVWTGVNGTWDNDPSGSATSNTNTAGQAVYYIALQGRDLNDGQKLISVAADLTYTPPGAYTPLAGAP